LNPSFEKEYKSQDCYWGQQPSDLVVEAARQGHGGVALDLGAGEGRNALYLARHGFSVVAVDIASSGLQKLAETASRDKLDITTQLADIATLELNRDYDLIIAVAVLHFLSKAQSRYLLKQMKAHTSSGGLNVVSVFTEDNPYKDFPGLFGRGELASIYTEWEVLHYEERLTAWERHGDKGKWHRHAIARLLVRKPGSVVSL
jgi:tellurite methyltransferase